MFVINNPLINNVMSKDEKNFVIVIIAVIAVLMLSMLFGNYNYLKETEFSSEFEPGTDSYMEDSLAYAHPDWSYERIQEELYGVPVVNIKMNHEEDSLSKVHPNWTYEQICDTLYGPEEDAY